MSTYASRRAPELQSARQALRAAVSDTQAPGQEARQHPRVFYRREPEADPFVVARSGQAAAQPAP